MLADDYANMLADGMLNEENEVFDVLMGAVRCGRGAGENTPCVTSSRLETIRVAG